MSNTKDKIEKIPEIPTTLGSRLWLGGKVDMTPKITTIEDAICTKHGRKGCYHKLPTTRLVTTRSKSVPKTTEIGYKDTWQVKLVCGFDNTELKHGRSKAWEFAFKLISSTFKEMVEEAELKQRTLTKDNPQYDLGFNMGKTVYKQNLLKKIEEGK